MPFNVPNALTWMRIVMIPLFVGVYYLPSDWLDAARQAKPVAAVFSSSPRSPIWFDGYPARASWNQTSAFGAFLDPVADKLMVAGGA